MARVKEPEDKARDKAISEIGSIASELTVERVRQWLEVGSRVDQLIREVAEKMGYDDIAEFLEDAVDFYYRNHEKYAEILQKLEQCEYEKAIYKAVAMPELKRRRTVDDLLSLVMTWRILELPEEELKKVINKLVGDEIGKARPKGTGIKDRIKPETDRLVIEEGEG